MFSLVAFVLKAMYVEEKVYNLLPNKTMELVKYAKHVLEEKIVRVVCVQILAVVISAHEAVKQMQNAERVQAAWIKMAESYV